MTQKCWRRTRRECKGKDPLLTWGRHHPPFYPEDTPARSPSLLSVSLKRSKSLPAELVSAGVLWKALGLIGCRKTKKENRMKPPFVFSPVSDSSQKFSLNHFRDLLLSRVRNHRSERPGATVSPPGGGNIPLPKKGERKSTSLR